MTVYEHDKHSERRWGMAILYITLVAILVVYVQVMGVPWLQGR